MKVTAEYVRKAFYRSFYAANLAQQNAIIESLQSIRDAQAPEPEEKPLLSKEEPTE